MPRQADSRFDEIYKRHRDDVTLYVQRRMAADAVADLVAETFLVCWRKLGDVPLAVEALDSQGSVIYQRSLGRLRARNRHGANRRRAGLPQVAETLDRAALKSP